MVGFHYQDAASAAVMMYPFGNWNHWCFQPVVDMDVSKNRGTPKWMVYNGKPYYIKWMIWRAHPYFRKHPHGTIGINGVSDSFEQFHSRMSAIELPEVFHDPWVGSMGENSKNLGDFGDESAIVSVLSPEIF